MIYIYVQLINEEVPSYIKVEALKLGDNTYKIISKNEYPSSDEWEFLTDEVVKCEERFDERNGSYLLAIKRMQVKIDTSFQHNYKLQVLEEIDPEYPSFFYPEKFLSKKTNEIILKIVPDTFETWIGSFVGKKGESDFCVVISSPNPNRLFVICMGVGYYISVDNPKLGENIDAAAISDAQIIFLMKLVVFVDLNKLIAFDMNGLKWNSKHFDCTNIKIVEINDTYIFVNYCNTENKIEKYSYIDVETGNDYFA